VPESLDAGLATLFIPVWREPGSVSAKNQQLRAA
jgi:hypothetical protein